MDLFDRMLELAREGFFCAQIMLILALEAEGKENADLVRAMGGLNEGLGFTTMDVCGALSGGCCLLSYFAGKGEPDEMEHPDFRAMTAELIAWFKEYTKEYGGHACKTILAGDSKNRIQRCPGLIQAVFEKCMELLGERGVL
ncbi:MAG: DVU_1555 family C-GCAxxG-C-C protein [Christensenellales bacterium]|jgi:C_GCAxxG_C_C family probable redox protein